MILPTKHISQENALLSIGSHILKLLSKEKTVSALWEEILVTHRDKQKSNSGMSYDWFVLTLDFLYTIKAIELNDGLLSRRRAVQ